MSICFLLARRLAAAGRHEKERHFGFCHDIAILREGPGEVKVSQRATSTSKLEIAVRLRRETTLSFKAFGGRVHLGASRRAAAKLHGCMRQGPATGAGQA
jgi:hypothetical protein